MPDGVLLLLFGLTAELFTANLRPPIELTPPSPVVVVVVDVDDRAAVRPDTLTAGCWQEGLLLLRATDCEPVVRISELEHRLTPPDDSGDEEAGAAGGGMVKVRDRVADNGRGAGAETWELSCSGDCTDCCCIHCKLSR